MYYLSMKLRNKCISIKECYVQNDFCGTLICQECLLPRLGPPLHAADPEVSVEEVRFWGWFNKTRAQITKGGGASQ